MENSAGTVTGVKGVTYKCPQLDLDKIENMEDCKKILKFLCGVTLQPIPENYRYAGFDEVERYFK